ncbi:CG8892 [Drosophila busckii]|uniref:CG8892 n=1 Tax=Drosophila busckii TaxID=30019 RepID=A0A0M4E5F6_DROBS|nr:LOW QUALITY PROTEIN: UBX domain-containing protein 7 [Drosophila busckii]ALC39334.1 CG8892 [Drosophila busckii]
MSTVDVAPTEELVERLIEVTACNAEEAKHLLNACNDDVAAAAELYFEQGAGSVADNSIAAAAPAALGDEEQVRAPILPVREQLILPEDDNFFASGSSNGQNSSRLQRVSQRVKVCPLRDFAREGALMEEQLQASGVYADPSTQRRRRERSAQLLNSARASTSRLGDLFRPPTELLYSGTLAAAREFASKRQQWLLINVQSDNFQSQTMNRDVWSIKELKSLVRRQFVFWQVDEDSAEGRRFVAFYHCAKLPYLCVIDPRTGEEIWHSAEPNQQNVLPDLRRFLREHRDFSLEEASTSKRAAIAIDDDDDDEEQSETQNPTPKKRAKLLELTEEEQLAMAIKNSMQENGNGNSNSDVESVGEGEKVEEPEQLDSYETQLGSQLEELTALKLRLLNEAGSDEMVQLRWPSDTKLKTLRLYIRQTHKHIPLEGYKLICAFPRKSLEVEHNEATLRELGLHPSANLHLTLDE